MIGKKINQLATELAPVSTDLTIIGDPISGVSKKITLAQLGAIFSGAVSFYTNLAGFPALGDINVIYCAKDTQKLYLWSGSAYVEVFPSQALLDTYQLRSEKGVSNGYASLDSSGKVPISQLPSSIMEYKGTWNAATNTPTLANGTGDTGDVYICNVAGTVNFGAGPITFAVGDYVIYSGSIWQRSSGAVGTVTSVAASITGNAIGITGSPVTTSGTLAFAFAGTGAQYIKGDGTLATFPSTIAQAERLITEVYNSTGATLTKGTIVYINGGQGNLPTVTKALATGDSTSAQTFGVVQADITNNNNGYVVVAGKLSDLDTQAYTEGTQLYLSSTTAGTWTSTKQYAPAHLVYVGIVVRAHPTQGIVEVKIQNGYELDEIHDVAAQNPDNNDILQYKTATNLWTKVAGTTSNIAEGSNLYYTDARSRAALSFTAGSGAYNSTTGVITIPTNTNQLTNGAAYITLASLSAGAGISYNNTTGVIASTITQYTDAMARASISGGTGISYNSTTGVITNTITQYTDSMARASISLTTTGTSGAATYNSTTGVLNVPQYAPDLSGYVPTSRTLTINGTAFDLSANRSWSVGTVTSVGLSSATSGVSIGSTPVTTSGTITLAIATASGTQQGLLSSTDWTTFNNKQNALTNPVTGTGTTNYLPKFTGTSTIGNSLVFDNGTNVGIGAGSSPNVNSRLTISDGTSISAYWRATNTNAATRDWCIITNNANFGDFAIRQGNSQGADATVGTDRLLLSASGNLGLGVTPSAWDTYKAIQIGSGSSVAGRTDGLPITLYSSNVFFDGTNYKYILNKPAVQYVQDANGGSHWWSIAPSGTAGNAISFTQAMTLTANNELLINTTSDAGDYKLQVNGSQNLGSTSLGQTILNIVSSTTGLSDIFFSDNVDNRGVIRYDHPSDFMSLWTAGGEKMRVNSSGNVGIGTTSPTSNLSVRNEGTSGISIIDVRGGVSGAGVVQISGNGTTLGSTSFDLIQNSAGALILQRDNNPLSFYTNNTERMRITSGGNVFIGDTSNASGSPTFYVKNKNGAVANIAGWNFGGTTTAENGNNNLLTSGAYYNGSSMVATQTTSTGYQQYSGIHVFYTDSGLTPGNAYSNTERMRITSGGDLELKGRSTTANFQTVFYNDNSQFAINATNTSTGKTINFNPANTFTALSLSSTGVATFSNEVIAGSWISAPNNKGLTLRNAANTAYRTAVYMNSSNVLIFGQDSDISALTLGVGSEAMRITSGGNVGIGVTSVGAKLQVAGTVEANGSLYRAVFGTTVQDADMTGITGGNGSELQIQSASTTRGAFLTLGGGMAFGEAMGGIAFYNSNNVDGKRCRAFIVGGQEGATSGEQGSYLSFGTVDNTGTVPSERLKITRSGNVEINTGSIKTGEPDTGWGRAAIKIGASVSGAAFNVTRYLPVSVDGTVYYINLNSSTP